MITLPPATTESPIKHLLYWGGGDNAARGLISREITYVVLESFTFLVIVAFMPIIAQSYEVNLNIIIGLCFQVKYIDTSYIYVILCDQKCVEIIVKSSISNGYSNYGIFPFQSCLLSSRANTGFKEGGGGVESTISLDCPDKFRLP